MNKSECQLLDGQEHTNKATEDLHVAQEGAYYQEKLFF